jgi:hypothetical protein
MNLAREKKRVGSCVIAPTKKLIKLAKILKNPQQNHKAVI